MKFLYIICPYEALSKTPQKFLIFNRIPFGAASQTATMTVKSVAEKLEEGYLRENSWGIHLAISDKSR